MQHRISTRTAKKATCTSKVVLLGVWTTTSTGHHKDSSKIKCSLLPDSFSSRFLALLPTPTPKRPPLSSATASQALSLTKLSNHSGPVILQVALFLEPSPSQIMSDYVANDYQAALLVPDDFRFDIDIDQYIDPALLDLHPCDAGQSG